MSALHNAVRRSLIGAHRWETTTLMVSYNTPIEVIEHLRLKIGEYISANSREWSNSALWIDKMEFQNALHLTVAIERQYLASRTLVRRY